MDCNECKATLYPENPELPQYNPHTNRYLASLCEGCRSTAQKRLDELAERTGNLEAISAQPGRIPRQYWNEFQEMRGELAYLRSKVCGGFAKPPKKPVLSQGVKL